MLHINRQHKTKFLYNLLVMLSRDTSMRNLAYDQGLISGHVIHSLDDEPRARYLELVNAIANAKYLELER